MKIKHDSNYNPDLSWIFSDLSALIAFGFGTGLSPIMPGTVGTLIAFVPAYFAIIFHCSPLFLWLGTVLLFFVGVKTASNTEKKLGYNDHSGIVIDEIVAMLLILLFVNPTFGNYLVTFLLFRLFDIVKPFPIRFIEKRVHGGVGIMLDDLLAALYVIALFLLWKKYL